MEVEVRACQIVAEALNVQAQVSMEDDLESLANWDSVTHMSVVLGVEEAIGRQLSADVIVSIVSLKSIAELLERSTQNA